jgi:excisionase family DNA binding protein
MTNEWLTVKEAAELLGVSTRTIWRYMAKGVLAFERKSHNARVRIVAASVRKLL